VERKPDVPSRGVRIGVPGGLRWRRRRGSDLI